MSLVCEAVQEGRAGPERTQRSRGLGFDTGALFVNASTCAQPVWGPLDHYGLTACPSPGYVHLCDPRVVIQTLTLGPIRLSWRVNAGARTNPEAVRAASVDLMTSTAKSPATTRSLALFSTPGMCRLYPPPCFGVPRLPERQYPSLSSGTLLSSEKWVTQSHGKSVPDTP